MELNLLCSLIKPQVVQTIPRNHHHSQTIQALKSACIVCDCDARGTKAARSQT
jgi:hypothetical protein